MKRFISITIIMAVCLLFSQIPITNAQEDPLDDLIIKDTELQKIELQKQDFKTKYGRVIPKDLNDILHYISANRALYIYQQAINFLSPYLPPTLRALARQFEQDAIRSIAGLDPGDLFLLRVAQPISSTPVSTPVTPSGTLIFSDNFEAGLNPASWNTFGNVRAERVNPTLGRAATLSPTTTNTASISHDFTLSAPSSVRTSFDYFLPSVPLNTTGNFRALLDRAVLVNFAVPTDALLDPSYISPSPGLLITGDIKSFDSGCTNSAAGSHGLSFESNRTAGQQEFPFVHVDNVTIQHCP